MNYLAAPSYVCLGQQIFCGNVVFTRCVSSHFSRSICTRCHRMLSHRPAPRSSVLPSLTHLLSFALKRLAPSRRDHFGWMMRRWCKDISLLCHRHISSAMHPLTPCALDDMFEHYYHHSIRFLGQNEKDVHFSAVQFDESLTSMHGICSVELTNERMQLMRLRAFHGTDQTTIQSVKAHSKLKVLQIFENVFG